MPATKYNLSLNPEQRNCSMCILLRFLLSSVLFLILLAGRFYLDQNNFSEASRYYHMVSAVNPSHEAYYGAAICELHNDMVERCIERLSATRYREPGVYYYLGVAHYRNGSYDIAAHYFDLLEHEEHTMWHAHYYQGLIALKKYRPDEAQRYMSIMPNNVYKDVLLDYLQEYEYLALAREKLQEGSYEDALRLYEQVDRFFGFREIGYAFSLAALGEYDASLVLLDSIISYSDEKQLVTMSLLEAADICLSADRLTQARDYLKRYLASEESDQVMFLLGMTFSEEARHDSALAYFAMLPDSVDAYLFHRGRTEYFIGMWGRAEEHLLLHREMFPASPHGDRATFILASINFRRREFDQALDFWSELVALYPHSRYAAAAQKGIGDVYFELRHYKKALDAYIMVDTYNPSVTLKSQSYLMMYETGFYLKKYASLLDALTAYVTDYPESPLVIKTRLRVADILFTNKHHYQSLAELEYIIEQYHRSSLIGQAFIDKARIHETIGNNGEVKQVYKQLLTDEHTSQYHSFAADKLGALYLKESRFDSALYYYNFLLDDDDYREKALFEIATIYNTLGQDEESDMMIENLVSEYPTSVFLLDAYILRTKAYRKQGHHADAIRVLEDFLEGAGQKPKILLELGHIYFEIEEYTKARQHYVLACERFEQQRDDAARSLLFAGDASVAIGDHEGAREYYLQANLIAESQLMKNQAATRLSTITEE